MKCTLNDHIMITEHDLQRLNLLSQLAYSNPLLTERIELERELLGAEFVTDEGTAWSRNPGQAANDRPNIVRITQMSVDLVEQLLRQRPGKRLPSGDVSARYWDVVTYVLLYRHIVPHTPDDLFRPSSVARIWKGFIADYERYAAAVAPKITQQQSAPHLFACLAQVHRAFVNIFEFILGDSAAAVRLRGAVWQSIFTADLARYRRSLYDRMNSLPVLITGPTGTGKELVARAIGLSQYIPFDEQRTRFVERDQTSFFPLNLSAMSASLIESELFGHCKGAFTGAVSERAGWLEECRPHGAVFLDEIGELDPALQVKLLRVVQQRTYSRLGETSERQFSGKLIGATNRIMTDEIAAGRFREDLYYRLCADRIETPSLREQLNDSPKDLNRLCHHIASRLVGDDADDLAAQALEWIAGHLGADYPWRGNIRELEQCVGSVMIRNEYVPPDSASVASKYPQWVDAACAGTLTADELTQWYCRWIYRQTGSYEASARQLGLDRRTVKSKIQQLEQSRRTADESH